MMTWYDEAISRIKKFQKEDNLLILDVGAGLGHLSHKLKNHFKDARIVALDLNAENMKAIRLRPEQLESFDIECCQEDAGESSFRDGVFDITVSAFSLQYWQHPIKVLNEVYRLTRPEGRFLITDLRRDMSESTVKKIARLSSLNNPGTNAKDIEIFLKLRLDRCYTPNEAAKLARKSKLKNWRVTNREYGFYLESLPIV